MLQKQLPLCQHLEASVLDVDYLTSQTCFFLKKILFCPVKYSGKQMEVCGWLQYLDWNNCMANFGFETEPIQKSSSTTEMSDLGQATLSQPISSQDFFCKDRVKYFINSVIEMTEIMILFGLAEQFLLWCYQEYIGRCAKSTKYNVSEHACLGQQWTYNCVSHTSLALIFWKKFHYWIYHWLYLTLLPA